MLKLFWRSMGQFVYNRMGGQSSFCNPNWSFIKLPPKDPREQLYMAWSNVQDIVVQQEIFIIQQYTRILTNIKD